MDGHLIFNQKQIEYTYITFRRPEPFQEVFAWMFMNNIHRCVDHHHMHNPVFRCIYYIVTICHNDIFINCIHHQFIHSHLPSFLVDLLHIHFFTSNNCTPANLSHQRITQHFRSIHPNYTPHHNPHFPTKKQHLAFFPWEKTPFKRIYTLFQKHRKKSVDASEIRLTTWDVHSGTLA